MKVLVKAPLDPHTVEGTHGIGIALALRQAGCDVYLDPSRVQVPLNPDVAELLTKRHRTPFDLLIHYGTPAQLGLRQRTSHITVAWTSHPHSTMGGLKGRSRLRRRLRDYDLVVGTDQVSTTALAPYVTTHAATVHGGYWPDHWPAAPRNWEVVFNFCMVGELSGFNPLVAIAAFNELRDENPELNIALNIKLSSELPQPRVQNWHEGVRVYVDDWDHTMMRTFYSRQHVMLVPDTAYDTAPLEMMSTGGSVIATNWGANTQWLGPATGYPVDYALMPVPDAQGSQWAAVSKQALKQAMYYAATHREEVQRKGDVAAEIMPALGAWPKVIDRLMDKVAEFGGDKGGHVLAGYHRDQRASQETRQAVPFL